MTQVVDYALLEHRKDLGILFFRWTTTIDSEQFKTGYNLVRETASQKQVNCWLLDTRLRGTANPEDENWYFTTYLPELHSQLEKEHYIAVLTTPAHYNHIRENIGFQKIEQVNHGTLLTMNFFSSEHDAVSWLRDRQAK